MQSEQIRAEVIDGSRGYTAEEVMAPLRRAAELLSLKISEKTNLVETYQLSKEMGAEELIFVVQTESNRADFDSFSADIQTNEPEFYRFYMETLRMGRPPPALCVLRPLAAMFMQGRMMLLRGDHKYTVEEALNVLGGEDTGDRTTKLLYSISEISTEDAKNLLSEYIRK